MNFFVPKRKKEIVYWGESQDFIISNFMPIIMWFEYAVNSEISSPCHANNFPLEKKNKPVWLLLGLKIKRHVEEFPAYYLLLFFQLYHSF